MKKSVIARSETTKQSDKNNMMRKTVFVSLIALAINFLLFAFISANANTKIKMVGYADGSGNVYNIFREKEGWTLEYKPVQPEFSSSGVYSGGEYVKKKITKSQYRKILSSINKAVENKKIHIKDRIMTSGMLTIQENKTTKTYIIKPHSTEQRDIEGVLKEIMKK